MSNRVISPDVKKNKVKLWTKPFVIILLINITLNLGQQMMGPLLAKYANSLGAAPAVVGLVTSMFSVTSLFFKIVSGPAIDTFNKKHVLICAMSILMIAFLGYSMSHTVTMLIVFCLIQGIGQSFTIACLLALAADTLTKENFGVGIGYFSLGQTVCQAIAPTISLKLLNVLGYSKTYVVGACIILCSVLICSRIKLDFTQTKKFKIHANQIIAKEALFPAVLMFFLTMTYSVVNSFLIIYAEGRGVAQISLYFTVSALALLFTRPLVGKLSDKYGFIKVAVPSFLFAALTFFVISWANNLWGFLLAGAVSAFGYGACQPAIQALCMKSTPQERRGAASVTSFIGSDTAILVGPFVAGLIAEKQGGYTPAMWQLMTIPTFFALLLVVVYSGKINRIEKQFNNVDETRSDKV